MASVAGSGRWRWRSLVASRSASESAFQSARAAYLETRLRADLARQKLSALGLDAAEVAAAQRRDEATPTLSTLRRYELRAPLAGRVVERRVDVGFGVFTVTAPLRWQPDVEQATPHGRYRLLLDGEEWWLQAFAGEWRPLYRLRRIEVHACDYVAPSYYLSTHPASHFTGNLMLARAGRDRRWTLFNRELSEYRGDGSVARRTLEDADAVIAALRDTFALPLDDQPELRGVAQARHRT